MPRSALRLLLLAIALLCSAHSHSDAGSPRIGFLSPSTPKGTAVVLAALRQGLREHGYVEGTNITIEARFGNDRFDRLPDLARELVGMPVDVLVAYVTQASIAAKQSTGTIPIVMIGVGDPVASGLVSSLSRPGANVTGTSGSFSESAGKRLQLLKEAVPSLQRVAILWNPANPIFQKQILEETNAAARQLGLELQYFEAHDSESIESAFAAISNQRVSAVNVLPDPVFAANWARIAALAAKSRLPSVSMNSAFAESGGYLAYGANIAELARGAGGYVAKILKGAKPAELAIERPTKFEFVINTRTAKQIGMTVPPSLRLRADRLIE
jgi:putative ABC transport system substrate-binding protein